MILMSLGRARSALVCNTQPSGVPPSDSPARPLRRRRVYRRQHGPACPETPLVRHRGRPGRLRGRVQGRSTVPVAFGLRPDGGDVRQTPRLICLRDSAVQHRAIDGPPGAQRAVVVRSVRARNHQRADPGQDRRRAAQREMGRRPSVAGLRCRPETVQAGGQRGRSR